MSGLDETPAPLTLPPAMRAALEAAYAEPPRAYHSLAHVAALTSSQLVALDSARLNALTTGQVVALGTTQLGNLTTGQVAAMETADLAALTTGQVRGFTSTGIAALTDSQLNDDLQLLKRLLQG